MPARIRLAAALPTVSDRLCRFLVPSNDLAVQGEGRGLRRRRARRATGMPPGCSLVPAAGGGFLLAPGRSVPDRRRQGLVLDVLVGGLRRPGRIVTRMAAAVVGVLTGEEDGGV